MYRNPVHHFSAVLFVLLPATLAAQTPAATAPALPVERPYAIEGTDKRFGSLQQAVNSIGAGSGTIVIADGSWRDCAVQVAGRVTYRAAHAGKAVFDGGICEDKATLVLRGAGARVEGLTFRNIAAGAGVRLEKGDLDLSRVAFRDSRQGLVATDDPATTIRIERATFSGLTGALDVGTVALLDIARSRFERGRGGDYVKSRAVRVSITGSSFDDTRGRGTRRMIDLPAGGTGRIRDNIFVQGAGRSEPFIALGADRKVAAGPLEIAGNEARVAAGGTRPRAIFLADFSGARQPLGANRLGPGVAPVEKRAAP